jgi:AcrR family transcriptional regulator
LEDNRRPEKQPGRAENARARILDTAYHLFARQGTRSVGIDTIIEKSGVAKMTLYRHFRSKQDLVIAFMERREKVWSTGWLMAEVCKRSINPRERLLAIFDIFDEWFSTEDFEGCSFINVLLEYQPREPLHDAAAKHLANIRGFLTELAVESGIPDAQAFADTWHILMKGSIISACEGNRKAAQEAKKAATLLLDNWRGD